MTWLRGTGRLDQPHTLDARWCPHCEVSARLWRCWVCDRPMMPAPYREPVRPAAVRP